MRKVREILRLRLGVGLSADKVAKSCKVGKTTVLEYEKRFRQAGLSWPLPDGVDDSFLERVVRTRLEEGKPRRDMPDIGYLISEMRRPHVTLHLLWLEHRESHPDGYGYTQFCHYYNFAKARIDPVLRQEHRAGEKLFTDYAGDTLTLTNPRTGHTRPVYIFVAVLGASNYTFAEAVTSLDVASWIGSHIRAFEFIGGVPEIVVPDNTRCAVLRPDRYEPDLNPSFAEMAAHYGAAIIPARVRRPRDKAKVEAGVLVVERWILAALRNRVFYSLADINEAISGLLDKLNARRFKRIDSSRDELFGKLDKPALAPLPQDRYQYAEWRTAKVNIDYHVVVDKHFYSVPHHLVGQQLDVRLTGTTVEMLSKGRRVASHPRSYIAGGYTTCSEHRPKSHQKYLEWTPSRIISWAARCGPSTAALAAKILERRPHPEQGYRSCLGIIRLADRFSAERVEAAAARALKCNAISYQSVKSILDKGLDRQPIGDAPAYIPVEHANIRGADYYRN